mmetsp:Transcript_59350/g.165723  ORF Transcript_59350/g.165723 Transcript_59350/m.165723 type:complete len:268 (+) Transcript_59350:736-1539(+)
MAADLHARWTTITCGAGSSANNSAIGFGWSPARSASGKSLPCSATAACAFSWTSFAPPSSAMLRLANHCWFTAPSVSAATASVCRSPPTTPSSTCLMPSAFTSSSSSSASLHCSLLSSDEPEVRSSSGMWKDRASASGNVATRRPMCSGAVLLSQTCNTVLSDLACWSSGLNKQCKELVSAPNTSISGGNRRRMKWSISALLSTLSGLQYCKKATVGLAASFSRRPCATSSGRPLSTRRAGRCCASWAATAPNRLAYAIRARLCAFI